MKKKTLVTLTLAVVFIGLGAWIYSCAVNPVTGKREFMMLTESDEIALGQQTDQQMPLSKLVDTSSTSARVSRFTITSVRSLSSRKTARLLPSGDQDPPGKRPFVRVPRLPLPSTATSSMELRGP